MKEANEINSVTQAGNSINPLAAMLAPLNTAIDKELKKMGGSAIASPATEASAPEPIDADRCLRGMRNIVVSGAPDAQGGSEGSRKGMIEEAISRILKDGKTAMDREALGFKQYAHFGDQRCDCEYGMGPRHGSVVFSVGRTYEARKVPTVLGADEIYLLECVRDFGSVEVPSEQDRNRTEKWNLCKVLSKVASIRHDFDFYSSYLTKATVDEQCAALSTPAPEASK